MTTNDVQWVRRQFKGNKVWLMADRKENPIVKNNKVLIKYNLKQDYEYWVHRRSVTDIDPDRLIRKRSPKNKNAQKKPALIPSDDAYQTARSQEAIIIFTDGASSGNPGPAGIGVVLQYKNRTKEISQGIGRATNNAAELEAIRIGLATLKQRHLPVKIFTDSQYALGVLKLGWKAKKNNELIRSIKRLMNQFVNIELIKIPGHSGIPENERADALAVAGAEADSNTSAPAANN